MTFTYCNRVNGKYTNRLQTRRLNCAVETLKFLCFFSFSNGFMCGYDRICSFAKFEGICRPVVGTVIVWCVLGKYGHYSCYNNWENVKILQKIGFKLETKKNWKGSTILLDSAKTQVNQLLKSDFVCVSLNIKKHWHNTTQIIFDFRVILKWSHFLVCRNFPWPCSLLRFILVLIYQPILDINWYACECFKNTLIFNVFYGFGDV